MKGVRHIDARVAVSPSNSPQTHWIRGWCGPPIRLGCVGKTDIEFRHLKALIQYKPKNAPFPNQYFNFNFLCLIHVSNLRVHLQEEGCIYSYGMVWYLKIDGLLTQGTKEVKCINVDWTDLAQSKIYFFYFVFLTPCDLRTKFCVCCSC